MTEGGRSVGPRVVLVGPSGAGKTTVGQILADRLGMPLRDTDQDVEDACAKTVADIFVEDGEPVFRERERQAVVAALAQHPGVLALGGGAVMDPATRQDLVGHPVVFLTVGLSEAVKRVGLGTARPLLMGNVRGQFKMMLERRAPVYREVASWRVDTDGRSPQDVADEVARTVAGHGADR